MFGRRESWEDQRARMVEEQLRWRGIRSERVLRVMGELPRERFLPPQRRSLAYEDRAVPLAHGQTISQPYMVAAMTEALELTGVERVLEVGTGSGYQTALLARLAREVFTVERVGELAAGARALLEEMGFPDLHFRVGDGTLGWPEEAPFHGILVTAGAPAVPGPLRSQLSPGGGRLVIPVGDRELQELVCVARQGDEFTTRTLMACRFVPLLGAEGWGGAAPQPPTT